MKLNCERKASFLRKKRMKYEMASELSQFSIVNDFLTRPNAGDGIWVLFLLPLSIIISLIKHPIVSTPTYKLASTLSTGLIFTSLAISLQRYRNDKIKVINIWTILATALIAIVFNINFHKDWKFAIISATTCTLLYSKLHIFILQNFQRCFTIGEAGLVSQSLIIMTYLTVLNVLNATEKTFRSHLQISTLIIQIGLLGIGAIALTAFVFKVKQTNVFYIVSSSTVMLLIFLPLHVLLNRSPVLWIMEVIFDDISTVKLIIYWSFCTGIAILTVSNQIFYAKKASTGMRKVFHILAVFVYIPGLLFKCFFLYLASGVVMGIFLALEILRILRVPPLGPHLQDGFVVFSDDKDVGNVSLTPIYLLVGCSLPLWIHPAPCDVTDSTTFSFVPLLSGLLAIGVGDTAASVLGSNYGKFYWSGSKKTIEGTIACILSQIGVVYLLVHFGAIESLSPEQTVRTYLAIFITSIIEAKTTQVDNLVLPLVMYILLI